MSLIATYVVWIELNLFMLIHYICLVMQKQQYFINLFII